MRPDVAHVGVRAASRRLCRVMRQAEVEDWVLVSDGIQLRARWSMVAKPRGVFVLCHGLTMDLEEKGLFTRFCDRAARQGWAAVSFDARSHGRSGGTSENIRLVAARSDIDAVLGVVYERLGAGVKMIPLGVSFGGAAAVHAAATATGCIGLVLWYAVVDYEANFGAESSVPFTRRMQAAAITTELPEWSSMPVLGSRYHLPRALVTEFPDDRTSATIAELSVPVLAFHGKRDRFVAIEPIQRLASKHAHVTLKQIPLGGHGLRAWRGPMMNRTLCWATTLRDDATSDACV